MRKEFAVKLFLDLAKDCHRMAMRRKGTSVAMYEWNKGRASAYFTAARAMSETDGSKMRKILARVTA